MSPRPDFDHTSFAVRDARSWGRLLRRTLGATPIAGETLPEFRYLLMYLGSAEAGGRIEFIEPTAGGFLTRYLDRRGQGPHHITFRVPDLHEAVRSVRALGAKVTGESHDHPAWREAFIAPTTVHGVVIQLAQSNVQYPSPAELLRTTERQVENFPSTAGAIEKTWWTDLWTTEIEGTAILGATHLSTTDLTFSRQLFGEVLGAQMIEGADGLEFRWPGGALAVHERPVAGVTAIDVTTGPAGVTKLGLSQLNGLFPMRQT